MGVDQATHRPGALKQKNKAHKTGRHRSKGAVDAAIKGKSDIKAISHRQKHQQNREERRNQMSQIRRNKREEVIAKKRQIGGQHTAPFLVCVVPLHSQIDPHSALAILEGCDEEAIVDKSAAGVTYINVPRFKQRFAFIVPPHGRGNELTVLDYLKVSDTTLFLTSAAMGEDDILDKWGHKMFNMIVAQGIPTPVVGIMDLESVNPKRRQQSKSSIQKFISKLLPDEKCMQLDTNAEGINVLRRIGGQKKKILPNKANRPHLFAEKVEYIPNPDSSLDTGTLKATGFLRGTPLDVNGLVHITGLGDFQMTQIEAQTDPYKLEKNRPDLPDLRVVAVADPAKQVSLQVENIPDPMDAEQTWPTEEEINQANEETKKTKLIKRMPKGWSKYQAAWIPDIEEVVEKDEDEDEDASEDDDSNDEDDEDFMSCENESEDGDEKDGNSEDEEFVETASMSEGVANDEKYDQTMDFQEERETLKHIQEARADQMWPDEMDTPLDIPARERFQKFRGLESFRTSPWDVKENLPSDYARIFQFKNFDRSRRRIVQEAKDIAGACPGWYVTIHIANVPTSKWNKFKSAQQSNNLVIYGLLPHEHQMSVMNVILKRIPDSEVPIKSKERLIVQCGYRRFVVNPVFSQHTNGDKHKFERYFRPESTVVATFYAPIQFSPAPVLCFKENPDSSLALVARGFVLSCNPDRVILKRVVLSGHPKRNNGKSATVRYMFFNKEDVEYFKPIKLRSKCGRVGHIRESLGTHGHMKCIFDGQLKSYDTIFLYLFKRVFPKWTYEECLVSCEDKNDNAMVE